MIFLSFKFRAEKSRFEINRLAETNRQYKILARFLTIYPGVLVLVRILALVSAILLVVFAAVSWGILGGLIVSFAAILLAFLVSKLLRGLAQSLIEKNLAFFNKFFAWAEILGRVQIYGDDPQITSEPELLHIIDSGDFMDDRTKTLIKNAVRFNGKTVTDIMTPSDAIFSVRARDPLTPKLIDELYNSGHKIFPVIQRNLDKIVGILYLEDIMMIEQVERSVADAMCKNPPTINKSADLETALRNMCKFDTTVLIIEDDDKVVVGMITLRDINDQLFDQQ